jgi:hypothetical protein
MKQRIATSMLIANCVLLAVGAAPRAEAVRPDGEVAYVSGGIGIAAQEQLRARESEFNLKLVFALAEGNYLADVGVVVKDAMGRTVINSTADGPFFMARLPAGSYMVRATYDGMTQARAVKVGNRLRTEYLRWPSRPGVDFPGPRDNKRGRWIESAAPPRFNGS